MPDGGGVETARSIWQIVPGLPVLFMSGYTEETSGTSGTSEPDLRHVAFLQKPFTTAQLLERLEAVMATEPS